jgi:hypothetical protein
VAVPLHLTHGVTFTGSRGGPQLRSSVWAAGRRAPGAVWVVWAKGRKGLNENHIRGAAIDAELVDAKVARFSATHSALKLVIPTAKRGRSDGRTEPVRWP